MEILEENLSKEEQDKLDLDYQVQLLDKVKEELGMNQSDIARKLDISSTTVSDWKKKRLTMRPMYKLLFELMIKDKHYQDIISSWQKMNHALNFLEKIHV